MPRIPTGNAGNAIVRPGASPRIGRPANMSAGVNAVANMFTAVGGQENQLQNEQKDLDAQIEVDGINQANKAQREADKAAAASAKLHAGNAVIRYELGADDVFRGLDRSLADGSISQEEYRKKAETDLSDLTKRLGKDVPELGRDQFGVGRERIAMRNELKIRDRFQKDTDDKQLAALDDGLENLERLAITDLNKAKAVAAGMLGEDGPFAAIKGDKAAGDAMQAFTERATRAHFQRRISDAQHSSGGLGDIRKEIANNVELDPGQQTAMLSSIDSRRAILSSKAEAQKARVAKAQEKTYSTLQDFVLAGKPAGARFAANTLAQLKNSSFYAPAQAMLRQAAKHAGFASQPVALQKAALQAAVAETVSQGSNPEKEKQINKLRQLHEAKARDYAADPWQAAAERGEIDGIPPLDMESPNGIIGGLADRLRVASELDHQAGETVSPLQPSEAEALTQMLGSLAAPEQSSLLGLVQNTIGPERMKALAGQMSAKDPTMGLVAAAAASDQKTDNGQSVGTLILAGADAIKNKQFKPDDSIRGVMHDFIAGAITDPNAARDAVDAAMKVMAGSAAGGNDMDAEEAIQAVVGKIVTHAGRQTPAPSSWSTEEFKASIGKVTAQDIGAAAGGRAMYVGRTIISPDELADQFGSIQLRAVGDGRYAMQVGNNLVSQGRWPVYITPVKPSHVPGFVDKVMGMFD